MAHGTFNVCAAIYRYDIQKTYDSQLSALTLFIGSTMAVRGAVNCFPRLLEAGTVSAGCSVRRGRCLNDWDHGDAAGYR